MLLFRALRQPAIPLALMLGVSPCAAQEEAPAEAPAAKAKPKPRAPKPAPKVSPAAASAAAPAAATQAAIWPTGAVSISESYADWTLNCARADATTSCTLTQSQGDNKTGRRQFAIELRTPKDGRAEGLILMPFGLAIDPGVTFKLDDAVLGKGAPFVSCTSEGCLVPISFPTPATDAMRTAKTLVVVGQKPGTNEPQPINVSLISFASVWDRALAFGG